MHLKPKERLAQYYEKRDDGCWIWTGVRNTDGYGRFRYEGRFLGAHRASYLIHVGPVADGLQLDHLCRVRACVNPAHLEPVTSRENTMRGESFAAVNAQKTHCPQGHAFEESGFVRYNGKRGCLLCRRAQTAAWGKKNRASRPKQFAECPICSCAFELTRKDKRYCSKACRNASRSWRATDENFVRPRGIEPHAVTSGRPSPRDDRRGGILGPFTEGPHK